MHGTYTHISDEDEDEPSSDPGGIDWVLDHRDKGRKYHCFQESLVGRTVFRELVQTFYAKVYVEQLLLTGGDLEDFLARDKWALGVRPLDHVRAVALDVHEEDFANPVVQDNLASLARLREGARVYIDLRCAPNVYITEEVLGCGARRCREVEFYSRDHADIQSFFNELGLLMPRLRKVVDKGVRLDVCFKNREKRPVVVRLFRHGKGGEVDLKTWMGSVLERQRVGAREVCAYGRETNFVMNRSW